jgi:ubiquinone/menaquinone biosynthesis C-methylase UbiE
MPLSSLEVQTINAYGPYNHGVWRGRGVTITHEESLSGRAESLVDVIRRTIKASYSPDEMAEMSLVDVGCYDGWILEQLSDLPFKRICGIEPRRRNIEKGEVIRQILGLHSRVEYREGSLENLGDERFDVVICCGLLHHVESIGRALDCLRAICKKMIFIEAQCLESKSVAPDLVRQIEPKDVAYLDREPLVGLVGHKFESSYYHGSALDLSVVSVPSPTAVQMFLERAGFVNIAVVIEPSAYWQSGSVKRHAKACCITAHVGVQKERPDIAETVERAALETILPEQVVRSVYGAICESKSPPLLALRERLIVWYLTAPSWASPMLLKWIKWFWPDLSQQEIIRSLRYAPLDKLELELAKIEYARSHHRACLEIAQRITTRLNADWRSVYRAFVLMACASKYIGDEDGFCRYRDWALTSNSKLPSSLFAQRR